MEAVVFLVGVAIGMYIGYRIDLFHKTKDNEESSLS